MTTGKKFTLISVLLGSMRFLKVRLGGIAADARGSEGGRTFSRNGSGLYIRRRVAPVQPRTAAQTLVRTRLVNVSQTWRGLTANQRNAWNSFTVNMPVKDKLGQTVQYSGQQAYMRLNTQLLAAGQAVIADPPLLAQLTNLTSLSLTTVQATPSLKIVYAPAIPATQVLMVYVTPQVSAGISFVSNKFRFLVAMVAANVTPYEIVTLWTALTGQSLIVGQKIFVKVVPVYKTTGQRGTPLIASVIVS